MQQHNFHFSAKTGTAGGTLSIILANITSSDITKTIILAALGAIVSFGVSHLLKYLFGKWKR